MNDNMNFPGLEGVRITKTEYIDGTYNIHVECPQKAHECPLREKGNKVEMVIMDMSYSFKSAVKQALGNQSLSRTASIFVGIFIGRLNESGAVNSTLFIRMT